jgi:hypothetical protein
MPKWDAFNAHCRENWYEPYLLAGAIFISVYFRLWGPGVRDFLYTPHITGNQYVERMWIQCGNGYYCWEVPSWYTSR